MGDQEETQEQMKADMSALKEQMASMMEAMLGMRQLMEKNVATAATVSSAAEVLQATVHHPPPNTVGRGRNTLGHNSNPHLGYNPVAYPYGLPPNYTPPVMQDDAGHISSPILEGEPPRQPDEVHEDHQEYAQRDVKFYPPILVEGPEPNTLPLPNLTAQPIILSTEGPPLATEERRKLDLLEERLRAIKGFGDYPFADMTDLCLVPDVVIPPKIQGVGLRQV